MVVGPRDRVGETDGDGGGFGDVQPGGHGGVAPSGIGRRAAHAAVPVACHCRFLETDELVVRLVSLGG